MNTTIPNPDDLAWEEYWHDFLKCHDALMTAPSKTHFYAAFRFGVTSERQRGQKALEEERARSGRLLEALECISMAIDCYGDGLHEKLPCVDMVRQAIKDFEERK